MNEETLKQERIKAVTSSGRIERKNNLIFHRTSTAHIGLSPLSFIIRFDVRIAIFRSKSDDGFRIFVTKCPLVNGFEDTTITVATWEELLKGKICILPKYFDKVKLGIDHDFDEFNDVMVVRAFTDYDETPNSPDNGQDYIIGVAAAPKTRAEVIFD